MESHSSAQAVTLRFDFGTFGGFNRRTKSDIEKLTAHEVISWDHEAHGRAEFRRADRPEVAEVFSGLGEITGPKLLALDKLLVGLGGDSIENYLRIWYGLFVIPEECVISDDLRELTVPGIKDLTVHIFTGRNLAKLRWEAAVKILKIYYPELYDFWTNSRWFTFDHDRFFDSFAPPTFFDPPRSFRVVDFTLGDRVALVIAPRSGRRLSR